MHLAQVNVPTELSFAAEAAYGDIFNEVELDVIFSDPAGRQWRSPAYWAGGKAFRVRFAPPARGRYAFRTVCTREGDAGLHGVTGELEAVPYEGPCELYRRGRLEVDPSRHVLRHADGTPFLWLADTWWMGFTTRLRWPEEFRLLAADRVAKGFNVIQIVAGPLPDFDAVTSSFDPGQANEGGWSWEKDWARINPGFFDLADRRIACLVELGLLPCIVGMWGYYLPTMGVERARKHWRYLVARYGAYPVAWCLCGECTMPTYSRHGSAELRDRDAAAQKAGWSEVARHVRCIDPQRNPLTVHPGWGVGGRGSLDDPALLDFDMLQTGHSGYLSLKGTIEQMRAAVEATPAMPVLNGEVNYEGILGGSWQEVQRYLFWSMMLSGACGHTYGAQGIWAMNSRQQPFRGTTGSWGDTFWQDAMHHAGSSQVGVARRWLMRYPWWLLRPRREPRADKLGRVSPLAAEIPGALAIFYLPAVCFGPELLGMAAGGRAVLPIALGPGGAWTAHYLNPRTGARVELGQVALDAEGRWQPPAPPSMEDWVLAVENGPGLAQRA